jgi:parallel beta-helix repeat protein
MNTKQFLIILTIIFTILISRPTYAVSCGDFITSNTTLTADLHCTTGYFAIEIGANNVTLDLNGFTLSGTTDLAGVVVSGRDNVSITGNGGVIEGFWAGVNTAESDYLQVNTTTFYGLGTGVIISSGSYAVIKNNDFIRIDAQGVRIFNSVAGYQANKNLVNNNEFYQSATGVEVCGGDSNKNTIKNNLIWQSNYYGIHISSSNSNTIYNNQIIDTTETAIRLDDSSKNRINSNSLRVGRVGLEILADAGYGCLDTGATTSSDNVFNGNHTFEYQTGIVMGIGTTKNSQVFKNDLRNNKLYDNILGIFFNDDAHNNDATGNAYTGTTTPIDDSGMDNSY